MIRRSPLRLHFAAVLALLALALFPVRVFGAEPRWESIGPWGHEGYRLVPTSEPKVLYLTTLFTRLLYRTDDQGASWRVVAELDLTVLAVDPRDPNRIVGCACGGSNPEVVQSDDGGRSFRPAGEGLVFADSIPFLAKLAYAPGNPDILYAATSSGLFRSVRRAPWVLIGFPGQSVFQFAIDPHRPASWVAAVADFGPDPEAPPISRLQSSTDAGATWSEMPGTIERDAIGLLLFDPIRPQRLYAVANWLLYRFGAGGWQRLGPADLPQALSLAASSSGQLICPSIAGILLSDDGGLSWTRSPAPRDTYFRVVSPTGSPSVFLASGGRGIWRSADGGRTWKPSSRGVTGFVVRDVVSATDGTLYVSPGLEGVFRSRDQGRTWERKVRGLGADSFSTPVLAVDPRHSEIVWAGGHELYRSTDGGESWQGCALPDRVDGREVVRIWVDPHREGVVIVQIISPTSPVDREWLTYVTEDNGRSWRPFGRFYRGLGSLALAPGATGELYADSLDGFFWSRDGGATWSRRNDVRGLGVVTIAVDPHDSATVWLGTYSQGVFRSIDGGTTFEPVRGGAPLFFEIDPIVFDPKDPEHPYVANEVTGLFRWSGTRNGWVRIGEKNRRFDGTINGPLAIDPERRILYAGTAGAGVYRLQLEER